MKFQVDIFLLGAQKAGTTTLSELLAQHEKIFLSTPKEPHYFTGNFSKGVVWYQGRFPQPGSKLFLDASTTYTMAPTCTTNLSEQDKKLTGVPERIKKHNNSPKFIYILRNPAYRTYSAYWHAVRAGIENRSFLDAISGNWSYIDTSNYLHQINQFLTFFSIDSFKFILFEEFVKSPVEVTQECYDFLGIERRNIKFKRAKNTTYLFNNYGVFLQKILPERIPTHLLPSSLITFLKKIFTKPVPIMTQMEYTYVLEKLSLDITLLKEVTGLNLELWDNMYPQ